MVAGLWLNVRATTGTCYLWPRVSCIFLIVITFVVK